MEESSIIISPEQRLSKAEEEAASASVTTSIDDVMTSFGWTQLSQSILVALALFIDAQQSFISVFSDAHPTWHCTDHATCDPRSDVCKIPRSSWTYDAPSHTTIISDWELQCASSFVTGFPQSSFFIGCFFGGFLLGSLADSSLGRKNLLLISCFAMSLFSSLVLLSTNVWTYSALKFLVGFFRSSIGTCTLVLLAEKVGKKWRFRVGILAFFCFSMGFLSLPAIAYVNRDSSWKFLYSWTSIPGFCYCVCVYFFLTESPRWLIMQGREEEAMADLRGGGIGDGDLVAATARLLHVPSSKQNAASIGGVYSSIATILERNWAIKRTVAVMVLAFGTGMVYYGMPLGAGNLGFNIYLAVTLNAFLEFPSYVATYLLENCKRRVSLLAFTSLSGVFSVMCGLVAGEGVVPVAKMGLELASFFCAAVVCNVVLIYATEMFPTCVRNTGTALVRQAMVCGAIFGPLLASVGRKSELVSYVVFGGVIMFCGFSVGYLPETHGTTLCDTMDQQEDKESLAHWSEDGYAAIV